MVGGHYTVQLCSNTCLDGSLYQQHMYTVQCSSGVWFLSPGTPGTQCMSCHVMLCCTVLCCVLSIAGGPSTRLATLTFGAGFGAGSAWQACAKDVSDSRGGIHYPTNKSHLSASTLCHEQHQEVRLHLQGFVLHLPGWCHVKVHRWHCCGCSLSLMRTSVQHCGNPGGKCVS